MTLKKRNEETDKVVKGLFGPEAFEKVRLEKLESAKEYTLEDVPKVPDYFPDFSLKTIYGKNWNLEEQLKNGPVIVNFFRGSWCPYCINELTELYEKYSAISSNLNVALITPQKPELSEKLKKELGLDFSMLYDEKNAFGSKLGLRFFQPSEIEKAQLKAGLNIKEYYDHPDEGLAVPATFVVNSDRMILYSFMDVDWTKRAEPEDYLNATK